MPFWDDKPLTELDEQEWEQLCDGCGKCCLHKVLPTREDLPEDAPMQAGEELHYVNVTCQLLDTETGGCKHYQNRLSYVPDCVVLSADNIEKIHFMPPSCAYRLRAEGKPIPTWHPLRHNGSRIPMVEAGMATTGYPLYNELDPELSENELEIIRWPLHIAK
ncbi:MULTISPECIES: YkgJ family cysteine cluster protein [Gammaproteobacteria]|uniref:YkgJ family cysteine cluster protein n=1 Tax=Gammaproteobacteria TaxID=1236 RepID=UPI000DD01228|nr:MULTISPECIES: YcgN family cysteine cluster protein [Gammaproteobacteria]RTE87602.1 YcgN family cysteine cluster protein [Aliidiomarina sp. B3213]TCZ92613.1 YcgN family cysteine cluster protein [Lysobacter sp. N42]